MALEDEVEDADDDQKADQEDDEDDPAEDLEHARQGAMPVPGAWAGRRGSFDRITLTGNAYIEGASN